MKITLSIATYERIDYVERMSASLLSSVDIDKVNVRIYDDCSPSLSLADLRKHFPYAKEITKRERNLRADANMKQIFEDFLQTDDDVLLLADSDLIYRSGWFEFLEQNLPQTDGILSLYDSRMHSFIGSIIGCYFAAKEHLGAAGTAFSRERVQDIVNAQMEGISYDWAWSRLLRELGYSLMCTTKSYIQHIGILGQNNNGVLSQYDFSYSFAPNNDVTDKIFSQFIEDMVTENDRIHNWLSIGKELREIRKYDLEFAEQYPTLSEYRRKKGGSIQHYLRIKTRRLLFRTLMKLK